MRKLEHRWLLIAIFLVLMDAYAFANDLCNTGAIRSANSADGNNCRATPYNLFPPATLTISPDPGYTQTFTYFTKSTTITVSASLTTNTNITGVRFTIDGGTYVDDTNTSDLNYSGVFSGISSGLHIIEARTMEGGSPTDIYISNQFYIVDQIWGFYGDSTAVGSYGSSKISRGLSNILTLADSMAVVTGEAKLNTIVQNLINCGIPAKNIYLSYPDYASHAPHDAINYLDEIDRVIANKAVSVGPDYYHFIKNNPALIDPGGFHLEWQGYSQRGRLLARYVLGSE